MRYFFMIAFAVLSILGMSHSASAKDGDIGCVTTAVKWIGPNHAVCVSSFRDPNVPGVVCHLSQARTGGIGGALGIAEDKSEFSLSCVQSGKIDLPLSIPQKQENIFTEKTSPFFKNTSVTRFYDKENNALVYLAISSKMIDGSPKNSISNVAISPWTVPGTTTGEVSAPISH